MKVVQPKFEFIEDKLAELPTLLRLEYCGRECYASRDKMKPGSCEPFVRKIRERGHNSVLEMASFALTVSTRGQPTLHMDFINTRPKYLKSLAFFETNEDGGKERKILIYGSVRAFLDHYKNYSHDWLTTKCATWIARNYPVLIPKAPLHAGTPIDVEEVDLSYIKKNVPEAVPWWRVCLKFRVNRAISHQLVRQRPASFLQESQRYCRYNEHVAFIDPRVYHPHWRDKLRYADWRHTMINCEAAYKDALAEGAIPQEAREVLPNATATNLLLYTSLEHWKEILNLRTAQGCDPPMRGMMRGLYHKFTDRWSWYFPRRVW
jgi:thymidylate synthase (FAD)